MFFKEKGNLEMSFFTAIRNRAFVIACLLAAVFLVPSPVLAQAPEVTEEEQAILKLGPEIAPRVFAGLGIRPSIVKDGIQVNDVFVRSAAAKAGLKINDIIIEIEGTPASSLDLEDALKKMRGKEGSEVSLKVRRKDVSNPLAFTFKRGLVIEDHPWNNAAYVTRLFDLLKPLADKGIAAAQNSLGAYYTAGLGGERDYARGLDWYGKAIAQGNAAAQFNLGALYSKGEGVEKNMEKALELFRASAENGFAEAQSLLGKYNETGENVPKNEEEAIKWYRLAAQNENTDAYVRLSALLAERDKVEACFWLRVAIGSRGHRYGTEALLFDLENDMTAAQREACKQRLRAWRPKSVLELTPKAEAGDRTAQARLVRFYHGWANSQPAGPEYAQADFAETMKWMKLAADDDDAMELHLVGSHFERGMYIKLEYPREAFEWYSKAAEKGNPYAMRAIGQIYAKGVGAKKDAVKALKWLLKAQTTGYSGHYLELGRMYQHGIGTDVNFIEAYKWYTVQETQMIRNDGCSTVSDNRDLNALAAKLEPEELAESKKRARAWLLELAEKGYRDALKQLARGFARGLLEEEQNFEEAYFWFRLAVDDRPTWRNSSDNKELEDVALHLTPDKIAALKKRAKEYKLPPARVYFWDTVYGTDKSSKEQEARCMSVAQKACRFDECLTDDGSPLPADYGCKIGWKWKSLD